MNIALTLNALLRAKKEEMKNAKRAGRRQILRRQRLEEEIK